MNFFDRIKQVKKDEPAQPAPTVTYTRQAMTPVEEMTPEARPAMTLRQKLQAPPPSAGATGVVATETIAADQAVSIEVGLVGKLEASVIPTERKAGPGRPRKAKTALVEPERVDCMGVPSEGITREQAREPEWDQGQGLQRTPPFIGYTLYINCLPLKGRPVLLGELLLPLQRQVTQELGQDYRLVDYSKGREALVYALEQLLIQHPPAGAIVVNMKENEANLCANVLAQYAAEVVHGF